MQILKALAPEGGQWWKSMRLAQHQVTPRGYSLSRGAPQPDPETLCAPASSSIGSALTSALPVLQGTVQASSSRKPLVLARPELVPYILPSSSKVGHMVPAYPTPSLRESPLNQMGGGGGGEVRVGLPASNPNLTPCWTAHSPFQNPVKESALRFSFQDGECMYFAFQED